MTPSAHRENDIIPPGSTIGILGSGQIGKMMAIAAKYMGYRVHVFSPSHDSPAGQVADLEFQADYDDLTAVERFAKQVDVITLEFENIPSKTLETASRFAPVRPGINALETTQNRVQEKQFLRDQLIPTCRFRVVRSLSELKSACGEIMPAILKTTSGGYDGKGQARINSPDDIEAAWHSLNAHEAILEEWIGFDFEFSIIAARNSAGLFSAFPSIRNEHRNQILDISVSPSGMDQKLELEANGIARRIMDALDAIGVMSIEFFCRNGEILVNEIAPRPHNSGHLTIEGHLTSQFEQHIRAICGLTLGSTEPTGPVALANLLGDLWDSGEPKWQLGLSMPNVKLHLYGKEIPESNRKMGHLIASSHSAEEAREHVQAARARLSSTAQQNHREFAQRP